MLISVLLIHRAHPPPVRRRLAAILGPGPRPLANVGAVFTARNGRPLLLFNRPES